jgi:hypothetical protein
MAAPPGHQHFNTCAFWGDTLYPNQNTLKERKVWKRRVKDLLSQTYERSWSLPQLFFTAMLDKAVCVKGQYGTAITTLEVSEIVS